MNDVFITNYAVKGIKSLDKLVSVSLYKKVITGDINTDDYNMKAIYGNNGSGKSAIISSFAILKNLLLETSYLEKEETQVLLESIVNHKLNELYIEVDFIAQNFNLRANFKYAVTLAKDGDKYIIKNESFKTKALTSKKQDYRIVFEIENGKIIKLVDSKEAKDFINDFKHESRKQLKTSSVCSIFLDKFEFNFLYRSILVYRLNALLALANNIYVISEINNSYNQDLGYFDLDNLSVSRYNSFLKYLKSLTSFIKVFKSDLIDIEIDNKIYDNKSICTVNMQYDGYKVNVDKESKGIKKLIKLYAYLKEMLNGSIVVIDDIDADLHDVYLNKLIEYLMHNGEGQLIFTTHNTNIMNTIKKNKKSLDFLSDDHIIFNWINSGNYSPSNLYRGGMIEGLSFNISAEDFADKLK